MVTVWATPLQTVNLQKCFCSVTYSPTLYATPMAALKMKVLKLWRELSCLKINSSLSVYSAGLCLSLSHRPHLYQRINC